MVAPKDNKPYFYSQKIAYRIIKKHANMCIVTNPTLYYLFEYKKKTWINGGIDLSLCGNADNKKYDAVFCGRIHKTKGIEELIRIWPLVKAKRAQAKLAIIGDGDMGMAYIRNKIWTDVMGIDLFGYMGDERFEIYKQSRFVLYPTPLKYDHFSMAPVEAMACGCILVCDDLPSVITMGAPHISFIEWINNEHIFDPQRSRDWAAQFTWESQTERVWEDIQCIF
jgi:glycosyltransferase involved in cell wall biosynthesis